MAPWYPVTAGAAPYHGGVTIGVNDYPWASRPPNSSDPWGYLIRECTSFCAWRIHNDLLRAVPQWGSGGQWFGHAIRAGVPTDHNPAPTSIISLAPGVNGALGQGHVGFVLAVQGSAVLVEDYNWAPYAYSHHTIPIAGSWFIHMPPPPPPPGGVRDMGATLNPPGQQVRFWTAADGHIMCAWFNESGAQGGWNGPVDASISWFGGALCSGDLSGTYDAAKGQQILDWTGPPSFPHQYHAWRDAKGWHAEIIPGT